jgi:hypothetical protein
VDKVRERLQAALQTLIEPVQLIFNSMTTTSVDVVGHGVRGHLKVPERSVSHALGSPIGKRELKCGTAQAAIGAA